MFLCILCNALSLFLCNISPLYFCTFRALYIIGRESLQKCNLDVQNPCLTRHSAVIFLAHFYTQNIILPNYIIPYILLLVKLTLRKLFSYIFHNKTFYIPSFFHKHFCAFPSHYVYSKRLPTILPMRRACYMNTFVWAARPSIFYVSMLNDFVASIYRNILCVLNFDCSGFLCAREYHFSSEGYKNRLEWTKLSVLFSAFSGLFLVCVFVQFVQIVYRKDCIICMKMRRRMCFRAAKSAVLASILSDFLLFFGMIYIGLNINRM